jgi:hypothetical protein
MTTPNPGTLLVGGIPRLLHIWHHWPAASDGQRSASTHAMKLIIQFLALVLAVAGCSRRMPPLSHSPSGTFTLVPSTPQKHDDPAYRCLVIEIRDATGKVLCHANTGARARRWTIEWTSDDQAVIYCCDIGTQHWGTQHWNRQADGSWKKQWD